MVLSGYAELKYLPLIAAKPGRRSRTKTKNRPAPLYILYILYIKQEEKSTQRKSKKCDSELLGASPGSTSVPQSPDSSWRSRIVFGSGSGTGYSRLSKSCPYTITALPVRPIISSPYCCFLLSRKSCSSGSGIPVPPVAKLCSFVLIMLHFPVHKRPSVMDARHYLPTSRYDHPLIFRSFHIIAYPYSSRPLELAVEQFGIAVGFWDLPQHFLCVTIGIRSDLMATVDFITELFCRVEEKIDDIVFCRNRSETFWGWDKPIEIVWPLDFRSWEWQQ
jgi:hypothetical protein